MKILRRIAEKTIWDVNRNKSVESITEQRQNWNNCASRKLFRDNRPIIKRKAEGMAKRGRKCK